MLFCPNSLLTTIIDFEISNVRNYINKPKKIDNNKFTSVFDENQINAIKGFYENNESIITTAKKENIIIEKDVNFSKKSNLLLKLGNNYSIIDNLVKEQITSSISRLSNENSLQNINKELKSRENAYLNSDKNIEYLEKDKKNFIKDCDNSFKKIKSFIDNPPENIDKLTKEQISQAEKKINQEIFKIKQELSFPIVNSPLEKLALIEALDNILNRDIVRLKNSTLNLQSKDDEITSIKNNKQTLSSNSQGSLYEIKEAKYITDRQKKSILEQNKVNPFLKGKTEEDFFTSKTTELNENIKNQENIYKINKNDSEEIKKIKVGLLLSLNNEKASYRDFKTFGISQGINQDNRALNRIFNLERTDEQKNLDKDKSILFEKDYNIELVASYNELKKQVIDLNDTEINVNYIANSNNFAGSKSLLKTSPNLSLGIFKDNFDIAKKEKDNNISLKLESSIANICMKSSINSLNCYYFKDKKLNTDNNGNVAQDMRDISLNKAKEILLKNPENKDAKEILELDNNYNNLSKEVNKDAEDLLERTKAQKAKIIAQMKCLQVDILNNKDEHTIASKLWEFRDWIGIGNKKFSYDQIDVKKLPEYISNIEKAFDKNIDFIKNFETANLDALNKNKSFSFYGNMREALYGSDENKKLSIDKLKFLPNYENILIDRKQLSAVNKESSQTILDKWLENGSIKLDDKNSLKNLSNSYQNLVPDLDDAIKLLSDMNNKYENMRITDVLGIDVSWMKINDKSPFAFLNDVGDFFNRTDTFEELAKIVVIEVATAGLATELSAARAVKFLEGMMEKAPNIVKKAYDSLVAFSKIAPEAIRGERSLGEGIKHLGRIMNKGEKFALEYEKANRTFNRVEKVEALASKSKYLVVSKIENVFNDIKSAYKNRSILAGNAVESMTRTLMIKNSLDGVGYVSEQFFGKNSSLTDFTNTLSDFFKSSTKDQFNYANISKRISRAFGNFCNFGVGEAQSELKNRLSDYLGINSNSKEEKFVNDLIRKQNKANIFLDAKLGEKLDPNSKTDLILYYLDLSPKNVQLNIKDLIFDYMKEASKKDINPEELSNKLEKIQNELKNSSLKIPTQKINNFISNEFANISLIKAKNELSNTNSNEDFYKKLQEKLNKENNNNSKFPKLTEEKIKQIVDYENQKKELSILPNLDSKNFNNKDIINELQQYKSRLIEIFSKTESKEDANDIAQNCLDQYLENIVSNENINKEDFLNILEIQEKFGSENGIRLKTILKSNSGESRLEELNISLSKDKLNFIITKQGQSLEIAKKDLDLIKTTDLGNLIKFPNSN
ncbi:MAG: hypothetical protein U0457_05585 [Candidatus Sericytochromatia bacterium]